MNGDDSTTTRRLVKLSLSECLKLDDRVKHNGCAKSGPLARIKRAVRGERQELPPPEQPQPAANVPRERSRSPEPPYCWQSKAARRIIREQMNGHESTASILSLYDALTEIASNEESEVFTAGQPFIGTIAAISVSTVKRLERILEEIGVIAIFRPRRRGHNTYKLLSFGDADALIAHGELSIAHSDPTIAHGGFRGSWPPVEEHKKEQEKEHLEEHSLAQPTAGAGERSEATSEPFEAFWSAYPKKRGKLAAKKAWLARRPPLPKVLETLAAFKASRDWRKDGGQFIPYPASWLNRGGWDDELPTQSNAVTAAPATPPPDRSLVNLEAFRAYLLEHYREEHQRKWTPQDAPDWAVRDFLNKT